MQHQQVGLHIHYQVLVEKHNEDIGSTSDFKLRRFLQLLNLSDTVTVRAAQPSELAALWRAGEIDGAFVWAPHLHDLQAELPTRTLITGGAMSGLGARTANM